MRREIQGSLGIVFSAIHQRADALGLAVTRRFEFLIAHEAPQISCHLGTFSKAKLKGAYMSFDWIEFACAESLLDEPTEFICGCGGDIVQRLDEEDFFCWDCCTRYEAIK
jgi:hypothetical protein